MPATFVTKAMTLEEFLVHDPLFVEFFNGFLSLPSFPEPICFNVETGGFEVVSDGKQQLTRQIKEAVRSQNTTAKMYRVARQHAFSTIPLIPIEESQGPDEVKIDTSYEVTTLNKDQGIYWIRAERLPIFLESNFYFTYRLAKVISQARLFNERGEFVVMKLDYTPRPKKVKTLVEVPPPNMEETIMKQMYISFGDVRGAHREAWFTQAKEHLQAKTTFTSLAPVVTAEVGGKDSAKSLETKEKSSVFHSHYFGVYSPGLTGGNECDPPIQDETTLNERLFASELQRPFTPRPSDKIHASTDMLRRKISKKSTSLEDMVQPGSLVKQWPVQDIQNADAESGIGETDERDDEFERRMSAQPIIDQIYSDGSWEEGVRGSIALNTVDDLGAVIVGAVLKRTVSKMLDIDEAHLEKDSIIRDIYPSDDLRCVTVDQLDLCFVTKQVGEDVDKTSQATEFKFDAVSLETAKSATVVQKEPVSIKWNKPINKSAEDHSDSESLLDSDDDFEEQDIHFRRNQFKWHKLTTLKGVMQFREFLKGTQGEKYWELWIDVDKGHLIADEEEEQKYIMNLRDRYYRHGAYFELSAQDKNKLGLQNLSSWVPKYLFLVHSRILEPLALYWAPRYLLRNLIRTEPEKYYLYNQLKSSEPARESDPHPNTQALLPLRPKSCCPRTRPGPALEEVGGEGSRPKTSLGRRQEAELVTSPMVGYRRVYGEDTINRLAKTSTAKYLGIQRTRLQKIECDSSPELSKRSTSVYRSSKGSVSGIERRTSSAKKTGHTSSLSNRSFVGGARHLPGAQARSSVHDAGATTVSAKSESTHRSKSASMNKLAASMHPCPCKPLTAILGESPDERTFATEQTLGQVKKPKDLLSPMLRVLDSQSAKSRRIASAPVKRTSSRETHEMTFFRQNCQDSSKVCGQQPTPVPADDVSPGGAVSPDGATQFALMLDCDFMGSERMEFLLQALHREQDSGRTFRKYIEKTEKKEWIYTLDFWERVQEYRRLFYKDKLDLFQISKKAKEIFAKFVVEGSASNVGVSESIELHIMERLNPPFEDLFDEAEEYALKTLFESFQMYLSQDVKTYCKVERSDVVRRLQTKNTYILNLQKQGIIKERPLTPDDPMEGYVDPVYDESVLERIPEQFRDWTLETLLHNRLELEHFRLYLADNYAEMDLKCWMDIEAWRRTPHQDSRKRDQRARDMKTNYLNKKYFFGPSSPAGKEGQNKVMEVGGGWGKFLEDKPASNSILEAQKYVQERLEKKHLPFFMLTREFQVRQSPKLSMADSVEDVVVQKKRRSQAMLKLLESKWVSSAKEVFAFQRALINPITCKLFQSYVATKGDNLENDLLFWLEVQNYKHMHHTHTEDVMLQQKITAIIHCFIESTIPPSLQIDVPQEMADRIMDHKHEKGPYLFREAQLATFRILLTHWQPFCEFRNNMDSYERALKTLERHRLVSRKKELEHKEATEKQKEKERLLRLELGLSENDDLPDELFDEDDAKRDKISFSYSGYLAEHDKKESIDGQDGSSDILLVKINEGSSQTIRFGAVKSSEAKYRGTADARRPLSAGKRDTPQATTTGNSKGRGKSTQALMEKDPSPPPVRPSSAVTAKQHPACTQGLVDSFIRKRKPTRHIPPLVRTEFVE